MYLCMCVRVCVCVWVCVRMSLSLSIYIYIHTHGDLATNCSPTTLSNKQKRWTANTKHKISPLWQYITKQHQCYCFF